MNESDFLSKLKTLNKVTDMVAGLFTSTPLNEGPEILKKQPDSTYGNSVPSMTEFALKNNY